MGNREAEKQSADARNVAPGLAELRQRVEACSLNTPGGSASAIILDADIHRALGLTGNIDYYTRSLDAVLALVGEQLPGWRLESLREAETRAVWHAALDRRVGLTSEVVGVAPTPALALLSALLAALDDGGPEGPSAKNEATA